MARIIQATILILVVFFLLPHSVYAGEKFIAPVFPIRGNDNWTLVQSPSVQTKTLVSLVSTNDITATWLVRYDALLDVDTANAVKPRLPQDEVGVFFEVTESLAKAANVKYETTGHWYDANKVFLSGYSINERVALIDETMNKFLSIYGQYPRTIGAWHIDAYSAKYLQDQYGVSGIIICSDQHSTDKYQLWGSYFGVPFIPSIKNLLVPASSINTRIPVVVGQWAARDALNGYGSTVDQSTYSVQANDYLQHGLTIDYFHQLAASYLDDTSNQYGFLLIGIENDYDLNLYKSEVELQLQYANSRAQNGELLVTTFTQFSNWYLQKFTTTPSHTVSIIDPLTSDQSASWQMNVNGRQGFVATEHGTTLRDSRVYDDTYSEPFLLTRNSLPHLYHTVPAQVDNSLGIKAPSPVANWQSLWPRFKWWHYLTILLFSLLTLSVALKRPFLALTIVACATLWTVPLIRSGQLMPYGLGFWGPHWHDGIWHIAIAEHFSRELSLNNPLISGGTLQNYHFIFDIILSLLSQITQLRTFVVYFHLLPFLMAIILALLIWYLVKKHTNSNRSAIFAMLISFTAGNAGWVITLYKDQAFGGESMFWAQQAISTLVNPPFALSLIFLLASILLINNYSLQPSLKKLLITSVFISLLIQIKVYASILLLGSLAVLVIKEFYSQREKLLNYQLNNFLSFNLLPLAKLFSLASFLSLILTLPFTNFDTSVTPFIWHPFWFVTTMVESQDRFSWPRMANAISAYKEMSLYHKLFLSLTLTSIIFFIGNFWTRIIGIAFYISKIRQLDLISQLMFSVFIIGIIFPLLFIQNGTAWNTIQFMYYSLFISSIWTGIAIAKVRHQGLSTLSLVFVVLVNLPTAYGTLQHYLPDRAPSRIPVEELSALEFMRTQPQGRILIYPHANIDDTDVPRSLSTYEAGAYVSAFSNHPSVLENINLELLGLDWQSKRNQIISFYNTRSLDLARKFISANDVKYIYRPAQDPLPSLTHELGAELVYDTGLVQIFYIPDNQLQ